jgi:NAD(P)-dependent dehydrogenase (short-subunit alcohol dehydrogenase family)
MSGRLQGKVAVITGGASGIGAGTAERFVAEGARVAIGDMDVERGADLARRLGDAALFVSTDVTCEAEVAALIATAIDRFGRLDCMFNNAGIGGVSGPIDQTDLGEAYQRTVGVLLTGPVAGMKHAAPIMRVQGSGSIISTASVAGMAGGMGPHVYSALKAAVINLTRSVALELAPHGIRVNAICPGGIATHIFAPGFARAGLPEGGNVDVPELMRPALARMQPIPRAGEPADIAGMALFLASDESSFVSGQAFAVDGALTAGRPRDPQQGNLVARVYRDAAAGATRRES